MKARTGPPTLSVHREALDFLNDLLTDVVFVNVMGKEPRAPITAERTQEASRHLCAIAQCREPAMFF